MGAGIVGAIIGGVLAAIATLLLWHPRTQGQRLGLFGLILTVATLPPMVGSLIDSERQREAGVISERDAKAREQAAREEMHRQFRGTRDEMTASVEQILLAIHKLPPGQQRARAIQSALLEYDRAASRLGPEASTGVAPLLALAVERPVFASSQVRDERRQPQPTKEEAITDATTSAAVVPSIVSGTESVPVVVPPMYIPPPPPPIIVPPPVVMSPR